MPLLPVIRDNLPSNSECHVAGSRIHRPFEPGFVGECDQLVWFRVPRSLRILSCLLGRHLHLWILLGRLGLHLLRDLAALAPELSSFGFPTLLSGRSRSASLFTPLGVSI